MLPIVYRDRYQAFKQGFERLQQTAQSTQLDITELRQQLQAVQQFFQQQIISLAEEDLDPSDEAQVRSYQTETSKQLRLLAMDFTLLQGARQPATVQARRVQVRDRIQTLIGYCDAILQISSEIDNEPG